MYTSSTERPPLRALMVRLCFVLLVGMGLIQVINHYLPGPTSQENSINPEKDSLLKQSYSHEQFFYCENRFPNREVYCVRKAWTINEFESGNIEVKETLDTLFMGILSLSEACPNSMLELTSR